MLYWILNHIIPVMGIILGVITEYVTAQCSEAHRQACSWPYVRLQLINSRDSPPTRYIPNYNETTLRRACDLYSEYRNCSEPFLDSCSEDVITEIHTFDNTLGFLCRHHFNDYVRHRNCFQRLQGSYSSCKQKHLTSLDTIDTSIPTYKYVLCSSSRDYVLCIYTATALGCSMQAADVYFALLNNSISNILYSYHYSCTIHHPLDVVSLYTTTPSTTVTYELPASTENAPNTQRPLNQDISRGSKMAAMQCLHVIFYGVVVELFILLYQNT